MTAYFVDTSAIGKRYLVEIGSKWIASIAQPNSGNLIAVSDLTEVEVWSAIERKLREARISQSDATSFQNEFMVDLKTQYFSVAVSEQVRKRARDLLSKHPLRNGRYPIGKRSGNSAASRHIVDVCQRRSCASLSRRSRRTRHR